MRIDPSKPNASLAFVTAGEAPDCSIAKRGQLCYPQFMLNMVITESAARRRQGELGQFLTPSPVADFMASLFGPLPNVVRLLDAGAGAGALTAALVSRLCEKKNSIRTIEATLYELDSLIQDALLETMQDCQRLCAEAGIQFSFTIHATDFIHEMSARLADNLFGTKPPTFDAAIVNPPYRKIGTDSAERRSLRHVGVETSNLYAGFIALTRIAQDLNSRGMPTKRRGERVNIGNVKGQCKVKPAFGTWSAGIVLKCLTNKTVQAFLATHETN